MENILGREKSVKQRRARKGGREEISNSDPSGREEMSISLVHTYLFAKPPSDSAVWMMVVMELMGERCEIVILEGDWKQRCRNKGWGKGGVRIRTRSRGEKRQ